MAVLEGQRRLRNILLMKVGCILLKHLLLLVHLSLEGLRPLNELVVVSDVFVLQAVLVVELGTLEETLVCFSGLVLEEVLLLYFSDFLIRLILEKIGFGISLQNILDFLQVSLQLLLFAAEILVVLLSQEHFIRVFLIIKDVVNISNLLLLIDYSINGHYHLLSEKSFLVLLLGLFLQSGLHMSANSNPSVMDVVLSDDVCQLVQVAGVQVHRLRNLVQGVLVIEL